MQTQEKAMVYAGFDMSGVALPDTRSDTTAEAMVALVRAVVTGVQPPDGSTVTGTLTTQAGDRFSIEQIGAMGDALAICGRDTAGGHCVVAVPAHLSQIVLSLSRGPDKAQRCPIAFMSEAAI